MASLRFSLIHPFTPSTCGVSEKEVQSLYTSLFLSLANLHHEGNWACDITFLTDHARYYESTDDHNLPWKFYPISLRGTASSREFGRQWSWALWQRLLFTPPTAVCLFIGGGAFAKAIALTCLLRRVPYFVIVAGWGVPQGRSQRFYFERARRVIVHTRRHVEVLERLGFSRQNMVVMPIGIDTQRFTPKPESQYDGVAPPRLLFVGRIVPRKGVLDAVDSLEQIRQQYPDASLQIVGPAADVNYFAAVKARIAQLGLQNSIQMDGQSVPNDQLPRVYQEADILLFPTTSESLGIVMLESMACGTPVVTLKGSGSTDEVVRHGIDGLVVGPRELASAVISLLNDRTTLKRMGLNAAKRVQSEYSYAVTSNILRKLLDDATGRITVQANV
jgi:glycosyltransferase involved in cell wall biosynthesis